MVGSHPGPVNTAEVRTMELRCRAKEMVVRELDSRAEPAEREIPHYA
jgi:hypothetical protein